MINSQIKVGDIYLVDFVGANSMVISKNNATNRFRQRFPKWGDVSGSQVRAVGWDSSAHSRKCVKFVVLPEPQGNTLDDKGEWCLATANYFSPLPVGTAPQPTNILAPPAPTNVCNCNIWVSGCTCGAMAQERKQKALKP